MNNLLLNIRYVYMRWLKILMSQMKEQNITETEGTEGYIKKKISMKCEDWYV